MLVAKQDKREQVMDIFDKLQQRLPSLELYRVVLPSRRIKQQLAQTYIHILDLIVCMTEWCAIGKLCEWFLAIYQRRHADGRDSKAC